jgi:hypothetical protein
VQREIWGRLESYRYALEHLVIEAPQGEAVAVERSLAKLEAYRHALDGLVGASGPDILCPRADPHVLVQADPALPMIAPAREPLVVKD